MRRIALWITCLALLMGAAGQAMSKTLRWSFQADILTLDPHSVNEPFTLGLLSNVMEPLVRYDEQDRLEPALATNWELVSPTVWRFDLRQGVSFHDGRPFSADDVVFSLRRGLSERSDFRSAFSPITEVRKLDEHAVEIELRHPYPILPNTLASFLIMSREWAEENGLDEPLDVRSGELEAGARTAVGTGPFTLQVYEADTRLVLTPNENWWDTPRHNLSEVVFMPIGADATRISALLSGDVDLIYPVPLQNIERINATSGFRVLERPSERTIYVGLDQHSEELHDSDVTGRNPFKDVRVRQAVYRAIDVDTILSQVMRGHATAAGLLHAPSLQGFVPELNPRDPHDPERAKQLLSEAGYGEGFSVGMNCPNDRYINDERICIAIVGMLARIGIRVDLLAETRSRFFEKVQNRNTSMFLMGWGAATTRDAHNVLSYVLHTPDGEQGTWNGAGYSNARVDELTDLIAFENDPESRQAMIAEAFRIAKEEVAYIPLHQQHVVWGVRDGVEVIQSPDDILRLNFVRIVD